MLFLLCILASAGAGVKWESATSPTSVSGNPLIFGNRSLFGHAIALNDNSSHLVVGMPRDPQHDERWNRGCYDDECQITTPPGQVLIYEYDHIFSKWITIWTLLGTEDEDRTGMSVAISGGLPMRVAVMSETEMRVYEQGIPAGAAWGQLGRSIPSPEDDWFTHMAMDAAGSRLAVAVPGIGQAEIGSPLGAALVYDLVGDDWALTATLEGDPFWTFPSIWGGTHVVAMSRDGRTIATGDPYAYIEGVIYLDELADDVGYVVVFKESADGGWERTFRVEGRWEDERCGEALALNGDGTRLAIGYPYGDSYFTSVTQVEKVRTFELGAAWQELGEPLTSGEGRDPTSSWGATMRDGFGAAVAFSADGDRLVVGAPFFRTGWEAGNRLGKVRVYAYDTSSTTGWKQVGDAPTGDNEASGGEWFYDALGTSVAISAAGDTFAAGMQQEGWRDCERCPGEVRVYEEGEGSDAAASTRVGALVAAVVLLAALL